MQKQFTRYIADSKKRTPVWQIIQSQVWRCWQLYKASHIAPLRLVLHYKFFFFFMSRNIKPQDQMQFQKCIPLLSATILKGFCKYVWILQKNRCYLFFCLGFTWRCKKTSRDGIHEKIPGAAPVTHSWFQWTHSWSEPTPPVVPLW